MTGAPTPRPGPPEGRSSGPDPTLAVRLYRFLTALLPPPVREQDGEEMIRVFAATWRDAAGPRRKLATGVRAFGGLATVAVLEWWEHPGRRRAGRRAGANVTSTGGGDGMDGMSRAMRYGVRSLRRSPTFTWSTVLLLGLGVGGVTTIFTIVDHVLLRPLPYPAQDRLFEVQEGSHSGPVFRDLHGLSAVEAWVATRRRDANLTGEGTPAQLQEVLVSEGFFPFFGARPAAGRLLVSDDHRGPAPVVVSWDAWQRVWGADPTLVGRTIRVDGTPRTVVGILEAPFRPPEALVGRSGVDLWSPLDLTQADYQVRDHHSLGVAGRLAPGAPLAAAAAEADEMAERRAREYPEQYRHRDGTISGLPLVPLREATTGNVGQGLGLLMGAVLVLLLVACVNVAHLFMARALARGREMAVRRALGAGRRALAGQLLAESLLVAAGGALVGVALAVGGLQAFLLLTPEAVPRAADIRIDVRILGFALALAAFTALSFGLVPGLRLAGKDPGDALRRGGRGSTGGRRMRRVQGALVAAEVALSMVLVAQGGLLLRSFASLHGQEPGFRTEDVWTAPLVLAGVEEPGQGPTRMDAVRDALARTPGVRAATWGLSVPLEYTGGSRCCWRTGVALPGEEESVPTMIHPVGRGWLDVFDAQLLAGTAWSEGDATADPLPTLVSEPLALRLFGSVGGAVGRLVEQTRQGRPAFRITGVVSEDRHYGVDEEHGPAMYLPTEAVPFPVDFGHAAVLVDPAAGSDLAARLREAIWQVEPDLPVPVVRSMDEWAARATSGTRFDSFLFATFGGVALLLAAGGLYGTLLYTVGMERRELGIRLALGAARRSVERRVLARGLGLAVAGTVVGGGLAWGAGRLLESRLFGVEPGDPATLLGSGAVLLTTAALAAWLPARRAAATDPVETLREE